MTKKRYTAGTESGAQPEPRYPRPEYYRKPLEPVIAGTIAWRHTREGVAECFMLDEHGGAHLVREWEFTHQELNSRMVRDPERRAHLFNPERSVYPGDADDAVDRASVNSARKLREYVSNLAARFGLK